MTAQDLGTRMERALKRVRVSTGASLAFGGPVNRAGNLLIERFDGPTLGALPGLTLDPSEGLGGKVAVMRRPIAVNDYFETQVITHRYDKVIRAERLKALVATPIIVGRQTVGVIYGAFRTSEVVGGRIEDTVVQEARALEQELAVSAVTSTNGVLSEEATVNARLREQVRSVYAELRLLAGSVGDADVRAALVKAAARLVDEGGRPESVGSASLTKREIDVLTVAGAGMTNVQIAGVLGLALFTVKSYMKSAMHKLGASTRLEAVVLARRDGMIA
ncbi:HTH-type transcriptional regulator MalT [Rhodococcus erythropolis]|uniref:helix-turn-helix transcriptional regulator n=1 Tax=Rhodococcus erythropolis TaxID=1833 RepID=UPI0015582062|nr:LuxR C-terminal-related transcriptional regulator [Rhodococcus erythropolis]PBI95598.1 HTH-type transcriptional regulator MalT [Rhodococcus erythropolis]